MTRSRASPRAVRRRSTESRSPTSSPPAARWSASAPRAAFRITNAFANESFTPLFGQTLVWRDIAFNGGVDSHGKPWASVGWGDITWDDITWENLSWESFAWLDITWETLTATTITWESVDSLSVGSLSGSGAGGWEL